MHEIASCVNNESWMGDADKRAWSTDASSVDWLNEEIEIKLLGTYTWTAEDSCSGKVEQNK